jgi:multidrug resistance protein
VPGSLFCPDAGSPCERRREVAQGRGTPAWWVAAPAGAEGPAATPESIRSATSMAERGATIEPVPAPSPRNASATEADNRVPVVAALMLTVGLAAIDSTIVATVVPQIVADLGGFSLFPWIFSIYLLTQAVTVPIYGRLSDIFGRKPVLLVGVAGFLAGSILCALAWSMVALIVFRGVQGLAAGAILPTTTTIIGDLYEPAERGRIQGYISSVWGISAIVGPALGGFFAEYWTWRGIFWLNLPIGVGAAWLIQHHLHERIERRDHKIDYAGALALTASCTLLIVALLEGASVGLGARPRALRSSRALPSCSSGSCRSSGRWLSRSCPCGSSVIARSSPAISLGSRSAQSSSARRPMCRRMRSVSSASVLLSRGSPWPR